MARKLLEVGQPAPLFSATTVTGQCVDLSEMKGKLVWILFYRYPGCPFCNRHIRSLARRMDWLNELEVNPIAIFDSPESAFSKSVINEVGLQTVPMIADPEHKLYDHYRVPRSVRGLLHPRSVYEVLQSLLGGGKQERITGNLFQMPASFLLDQVGELQDCHYGTTVGDLPTWESVQWFSKKFRVATWAPEVPTSFSDASLKRKWVP